MTHRPSCDDEEFERILEDIRKELTDCIGFLYEDSD